MATPRELPLKPTFITADFETYYSQTYSLTKETTESYIRSPQYETIGVSLKLNDEPAVWVPQPRVDKVLRQNNWSDKMVICQNTAFDGAIMNWHYGVDPLLWIDIMGMSRALFPHERSHSLAKQAERMGVGVKGDEVMNAVNKRIATVSGSHVINDQITLTSDFLYGFTETNYQLNPQPVTGGCP